MASTTPVQSDEHAAASPAPPPAPRPARSAEQTVTRGDTAGAGAGATASTASGATASDHDAGADSRPNYTLLSPPDYDGIVGGVPPSPFASAILLLGLLCLAVGAVGSALGSPMDEWWVVGGMLVAIALFLAAFISRSA